MTLEEKVIFIKETCEKLNITAYEIGENTQISNVAAYKILTGESKKPREKTLGIIIRYLESRINEEKGTLNESKSHYYTNPQERKELPKASDKSGVPYFNVDFSSGYDLFENNQTTNPNFYIDYAPYNHADLWINNVGNSMRPKIENGDIVALQQKHDINQMLYGEIYAVVFPEIRTIKYIRKSDKDDHILLVPHDLTNFDEQDMPKNLIKSFFLVLGSIKKFF